MTNFAPCGIADLWRIHEAFCKIIVQCKKALIFASLRAVHDCVGNDPRNSPQLSAADQKWSMLRATRGATKLERYDGATSAPDGYRSAISQPRRSSTVSQTEQMGRFTSSRGWPISIRASDRSAAWHDSIPALPARAAMIAYAIATQKIRLLSFIWVLLLRADG
jgi:hypothetical protein